MSELIGPLTAEEWCSLRAKDEDDVLRCCAETSNLRDAIFKTLRMGGDRQIWASVFLGEVAGVIDSHEGILDDPRIRKLFEFAQLDTPERRARAREVDREAQELARRFYSDEG